MEKLQVYTFLNKGLEIRFTNERPNHDAKPKVFRYNSDIEDFVRHLNASKEWRR